MPIAAKPCNAPGCRGLVYNGGSRCRHCRRAAQRQQDALRGTAHERYGSEHRKLRAQVLLEEAICGICLGPGLDDDVLEHKIPVSRGGLTVRENVRRAHANCNAKKAAREGWHRGKGQP